MTKSRSAYFSPSSWYVRLGNSLKRFPQGLARGSQKAPETSSAAAAALISAGFASFVMMVNQHFAATFKSYEDLIWNLGAWIPGSRNADPLYGEIGSYTGKETILLVTWLVSWLFLAWLWRDREIKGNTIFFSLFFFLVAATVMNWHPLFPYMPLMPK
ncbi:hypothetical protein C7B62_22830 [Pleurocapsa sp. CCALA 161]|uniref:hypothetical protein n=1 Tax=Pleurocapsa sp. CCALA 161 TaxID=2107688 RepID=UPI000D072155|nr:hypothetical protein [Pleurocapsa sp. CCALA 161]PSB06427.1 hypothetical protein C7B62_22830 [Pleurocapsa sp. CCALA 161]